MTPLALVTGAGGFIGSAAARALRERGWRVRAGARRGGPDFVACDLDRPHEVRAAAAGVDLVVHAAYGEVARMPAQARALLEAMAAERVNRLIALSSIAVYGEAAGRVGETTAPAGALDAYARGKLACETLYRSWASEAGRAALVLRPGIVYGAGSRFWIDKLAARIRAGAWGEFGARGEGIAPLIHAADAAGFIALAAGERLADARSRTINLVGPETPSWNAYFRALADTLGAAPLPCWSARELAARQALAIGAKAWTRLGLPGARAAALAPSAGEIALFSRKAQYSTGAARALGFAPRIGLAEGLARSRIG